MCVYVGLYVCLKNMSIHLLGLLLRKLVKWYKHVKKEYKEHVVAGQGE